MSVSRSRRARFVRSFGLAILLGALTGVPGAVARVEAPDARSPIVAPAAVAPTRVAPASVAPAALASGQLTVVKVTGSLSSPLGVTNAGDGSGRLFVVQQGGRVRIVKGGKITGTFLDITSKITSGGERGLLGLAFHPDFATNGLLWVYYTDVNGSVAIARMQANAARTFASASTLDPIMTIGHSLHANHNGGALAFGPDGYLYAGVGDGGGAGDPQENGQDLSVLLGKILRINPTLGGANATYAIPADNPFVGIAGRRGEIWDYGVRNPWRITFDRTGGDLYIADVGQSRREEVNLEDVADPGGNNYGWDVMEGSLCYEPSSGCSTAGKVLPVAQYSHTYGCSITGGYVYRGSHRDLQGLYVYGDFCSGRIWTMNASGTGETVRRDTSLNISSFGESEAGELYLTDLNGALYRVIAPEFSDIANSTFIEDIHWLFYQGITGGCGSGKFCPRSAVTRVQMAQFLVRAFNHPTTATDYFTDDNGITGESSINALAEAGITGGCAPNLFCPTRPVTRAQMAIFLVNELNLPPTSTDFFDDDDGKTGESSINRLAAAGLTGGCGTRRYCPTSNVTREQMAAFLHRALT
jgi:glucose/arabinose dehydrogenase